MIFKDSNNDTCFADVAPDGWTEITEQELNAIRESRRVPVAVAIPPLTPRQVRMALSRIGLRAAVEGAVVSGDQDLKDWWEWSQTFERLHPAVVAMGAALGQTDEAMDALWALGATL